MRKVKVTILEVYELEVPEEAQNKVVEAQKLLDKLVHFKERRVILSGVEDIKKAADSLEYKEQENGD